MRTGLNAEWRNVQTSFFICHIPSSVSIMQISDISKIKPLQDEIVRLLEWQKTNLESLKKSGLLSESSIKDTESKIQVLNTEIAKAKQLELLVMVMGAMKAGKSTTINAIVGTDVLPHRSGAMTSLPTVIRHKPHQKTPRLQFAKHKEFNALIHKINKELNNQKNYSSKNSDLQELIQKIKKNSIQFEKEYEGQDGIYQFLFYFNDLMRLAKELEIDTDEQLKHAQRLEDFPQIEIEFNSLSGTEHISGSFSLLDTPGPNEASANDELRDILERQLQNASAVLAVFDYTQRNSDAEKEIKDYLNEVKKEHLFIALNKADQEKNKKNIPVTQEEVAQNMAIPKDQVIAVSADRVNLINKALACLEQHEALPSPDEHPWVDSFAQNVLGSGYDEEDLKDIEEIKGRSKKSLKRSEFPALINSVVVSCCQNTPKMVFGAALITLNKSDGFVTDFIERREVSAHNTKADLEKAIEKSKSHIKEIEKIKDKFNLILKDKRNFLIEKIQSEKNIINEEAKKIVEKTIQNEIYKSDIVNHMVEEANKRLAQLHAEGLETLTSTSKNEKRIRDKIEHIQDLLGKIIKREALVFKISQEAEKINTAILVAIKENLKPLQGQLEKTFKSIANNTNTEIKTEINKGMESSISNINKDMKDFGFSLNFMIPNKNLLKIENFDFDEVKGFSEKTIQEARVTYKKRKGFVEGFRRFISLGMYKGVDEIRHEKEVLYELDLKNMEQQVYDELNFQFDELTENLNSFVEQHINADIKKAENQIIQKLNQWRDDCQLEIENKTKEKDEQKRLKDALEATKKAHHALKQDVDATQQEMRLLLGA